MSSSAICVWYEQHTHTYHTRIHIQMYLHYKCVPPCFSFKGRFCLNKMHIHMYLYMNVHEFMYVYKTLNKLLKLQAIQQNHIWSFQNLRRGYIFITLQIRKMPEVKLQILLRNWNDRLQRLLLGEKQWQVWTWYKASGSEENHAFTNEQFVLFFSKHLTNVLDNFKLIMHSWLFLRLIKAYYSTSWKGKHIDALWLLHN